MNFQTLSQESFHEWPHLLHLESEKSQGVKGAFTTLIEKNDFLPTASLSPAILDAGASRLRKEEEAPYLS